MIHATIISFLLAMLPTSKADRAAAITHYQAAVEAEKAEDWPAYLNRIRQANRLWKGHPVLIRRLAEAFAATDSLEQSVHWLHRLASMRVHVDLEQNRLLRENLPSTTRSALGELLASRASPFVRSDTAFSIAERDLIPESVAFDPETGAFYLSSIHKSKIVRVDRSGIAHDFVLPRAYGLRSVFALLVDSRERLLWACTGTVPNMDGYERSMQEWSAVLAFDLGTGELKAKAELGAGETGHNLNDLCLDSDGTLYLTDNKAAALYRLDRPGSQLQRVPGDSVFANPQGVVAWEGGQLIVADYSLGLIAIDPVTGRASAFDAPDSVSLLGIDGLSRYGSQLIAIQNGVTPHRVLRLEPSPRLDAFTNIEVLEMAHPAYDEPTLGVVVKDRFYYVANSQWGKFERDGTIFPVEKLRAPVVLKLQLR